jgi:hypothetical protein
MCETVPGRSLTYVGGASLAIDGHIRLYPIIHPYIKNHKSIETDPIDSPLILICDPIDFENPDSDVI